jgi:hypothetical protein
MHRERSKAVGWLVVLGLLMQIGVAGCHGGNTINCDQAPVDCTKWVCDWSTAQRPTTWCPQAKAFYLLSCADGFTAVSPDAYTTAFYKEGKLAAVAYETGEGPICMAGTVSTFAIPDCTTAAILSCATLPASDAGTQDAALSVP